MASLIREATEEERGLARHIAEEFPHNSPEREQVLIAEGDKGLQAIITKGVQNEMKILLPSKRVLVWDLNLRSLGTLENYGPNTEIGSAAAYAGIILSKYLELSK